MRSRRSFVSGLVSALAALVLARPVGAQSSPGRGGQQRLSLADQLIVGLRPRRKAEFAFIEQVVAQVEQGDLPLPLVVTTFNWARKKTPYPFPYFQVALTRRAKAMGVQLSSDLGG